MTKEKRECEKCRTVIYLKQSNRNQYSAFQDGVSQMGESLKYPGEIAGFCKKHEPK